MDSDWLASFVPNYIKKLDATLVGIEEPLRQLQTAVDQFFAAGQGESIMVCGEPHSGRMSAILEVAGKYIDSKCSCNCVDVSLLCAEKAVLRNIELDDEEGASRFKKRIIIVRAADELASRIRQGALYSLLESARKKSWLVFLVVSRQDFAMRLEKRIRSRISQRKVVIGGPATSAEHFGCFRQLLLCGSKEWDAFVAEFCLTDDVRAVLDSVFEVDASPRTLKRVIACFAQALLTESPLNAFYEAIEFCAPWALPQTPKTPNILTDLPLRRVYLLLCIARRFRNGYPDVPVTYKKIITDYKLLANRHDKRMLGDPDVEVYKELDLLNELALIEVLDEANANMPSRRLVLRHSWEMIEHVALSSHPIPEDVRNFVRDIPAD